jgi:CBS domain-containing protein
MPFIIQHLIPETQNLVIVTENDSAQYALSLMIEHDFSQLPVTDGNQKLKGMITSDSILRAVSNFKVIPENLKVSHAVVKAKSYRIDEDLSELLKGLRDNSAIPISDSNGNIKAIVTSHDTAEYFRRRAEDLMLAEDIEFTLRDFIRPTNADNPDEIDDNATALLIQGILPSDKERKKKFRKALQSYLSQADGIQPQINNALIDSVFEQHLGQSAVQKTFEDLTLYELIQVFKNLWHNYQTEFRDLTWEAVDPLLNGVRETRNAIAHFREITPQQRQQLKFCADFLDRHRPVVELPEPASSLSISNIYRNLMASAGDVRIHREVIANFNKSIGKVQSDLASVDNTLAESPNFNLPEEEIEANDSRYAPLAIWLQTQEADRLTCTFKEIETIIHDELPPSARQHRNWWANDSISHTQSIQWLEVGWRVSSVNMSTERVVFSRMGDRQSAYINFFGQLQDKLQSIKDLSITPQINQQGRSWLVFAINPTDYDSAKSRYIVFSFARRSRFRIEIYINEREQKQTKQIFDRLQDQKTEIETEFSAALSWERLNHRHASRIAYYRPDSSITDSPKKLDEIQDWAVETLPKFYAALSDRFIAAQKEFINKENDKSP